jgi:hypothetical protein
MTTFFRSPAGILTTIGVLMLVVPALNFVVGGPGALSGVDLRGKMQVIVSLIVLICSLYIILSKKYEADTQKWAFGAIGTVVGYWLPSTST